MPKLARVTYRRRHSYNTKSNRFSLVKTPGGKLAVQYVAKKAAKAKCGDCGTALHGLPQFRPKQLKSVAKRHKTVSRAYGGSRCAACVRDRVVRAFIIEEQKIVKKMVSGKSAAVAAAPAPAEQKKAASKKDGKDGKKAKKGKDGKKKESTKAPKK
eukprot:CAMPEP_0198340060 /NCGR_PEP_ID=MMETSP1450-20131203/42086_1 /TAXON_ID=753684 ORGANISM="Madagascaria erythrocladiodes, Strain CCMP3234" /NCGR_SAMPLE_ID=MMETSP1450 /ASSEMBLY_ACC=CAM_ASM_001115 /LENGTH=155 /DNA_ID=CAMNT_0044045021 /DNA_START=53 /DNA_END=520 /DNA_ORIENTATION=+